MTLETFLLVLTIAGGVSIVLGLAFAVWMLRRVNAERAAFAARMEQQRRQMDRGLRPIGDRLQL